MYVQCLCECVSVSPSIYSMCSVSVCESVCVYVSVCECVCVCVCMSVCVCSIVPLEADPSEGKAVSGDSVTIMLAVQQ